MAIDKDPSIYRDRGTIGSSDELDEYGVWVKSEPQDLPSSDEAPGALHEPDLPDIEDLPDLELDSDTNLDFSSFEEVKSSGTEEPMEFDIPSIPEDEPEHLAPLSPEPTLNEDFSVDEVSVIDEGLPSFEDIASFEEENAADTPSVSANDFAELSMDDFLEEGGAPDLSGKETENLPEEQPLDLDLEFHEGETVESESPEASSKTNTSGSIQLENVSEFDDFLSDLSKSEEESSPKIDENLAISSSEGKAERVVESMESPAPRNTPSSVDLSTQLLMRIAEELSSIKNEISSLKGELASFKAETKTAPESAVAEESSSSGFFDEEDDEKIALTGDELDNILNTADFTEEAGSDATEETDFSESMDYLSEQPDILTEESESAAPEEFTLEEGPAQEEVIPGLSTEESATEESATEEAATEETPTEESVTEEIVLEEAPSESTLPEELVELQENGVRPITEAPEDTSYLESEVLEEDNLDLSQAIIDEPDLTGVVLEEAPVEEPSIEAIHIDLDMEESLHVEDREGEIEGPLEEESTELDIPTFESESLPPLDEEVPLIQEDNFSELVPEGFVVEPEETPEESSIPSFEEEIPEVSEAAEETVGELVAEELETPALPEKEIGAPSAEPPVPELNNSIREEVKTVLSYMDQLLESLPEDKIEEFARSEYFDTYKKLFEELGLV